MTLKATCDAFLVTLADAFYGPRKAAVFIGREKYQAVTLMARNDHRFTHRSIAESADVVLELCGCNAGHFDFLSVNVYMAKMSNLSTEDLPEDYDTWFRTKVPEALNDQRPTQPHEQVMHAAQALIDAKRQHLPE